MQENGIDLEGSVDGWTNEQMKQFIDEHKHLLSDLRQA